MDAIASWMDALQGWSAAREALRVDLLGRLVLATFLGGVVGWEREASGKPAGLRTNILICVGAALLTDLSIRFGTLAGVGGFADPARITAQIVSGIGFLGAGTILQARGTVVGLTTAATLWVVAAIGMTVGAGAYIEAVGTALLVVVVLGPLGWVEDRIDAVRRGRILRVVLEVGSGKIDEIQSLLEDGGLRVRLESLVKGREGEEQATFDVRGGSAAYRRARAEILEIPEVRAVFRT